MQRILLAIAVLFLLMTPVAAAELHDDPMYATESSMDHAVKLAKEATTAAIIITNDAAKATSVALNTIDALKAAIEEAQKNGDETAVKVYKSALVSVEKAVKNTVKIVEFASEAGKLADEAAELTKNASQEVTAITPTGN